MTIWTVPLTEYTNDADKGIVVCHWRATATETDGDYYSSLQAHTALVDLHLILLHLTLYRLSH
jgi:hypothetical protein